MKIRNKLTLQSTIIIAIILALPFFILDSDWIRTSSNPFNLRAMTELLKIDSKLFKLKNPSNPTI
jgi:hypothetical protein